MLAGAPVILTEAVGSTFKKAHFHAYWQEIPFPFGCWHRASVPFHMDLSLHKIVKYLHDMVAGFSQSR